jgi:hypothetical protein
MNDLLLWTSPSFFHLPLWETLCLALLVINPTVMSRRESIFSSDQFSIATKTTSNSQILLENMVRSLKQELFQTEYSPEQLQQWNEKILKSYQDLDRNNYRIKITSEVISNLGKRDVPASSSSSSSSGEEEKGGGGDIEKNFKEIKSSLQSKLNKYHPETSESFKKFQKILNVFLPLSLLSSPP